MGLNAQITLEKINPGLIYEVAKNDFMYTYWDQANNTLDLHHFDHSHYKTVTLPSGSNEIIYNIGYITRGLFDCDSSNIEMMLLVQDTSTTSVLKQSIVILREDGTVVWQKDSATIGTTLSATGLRTSIFNTPQGAKMYLYNAGKARGELYSLCGTNPMSDQFVSNTSSDVNAFPNPARQFVTLRYQFPDGISKGSLIVTDATGMTVREFNINQNFDSILMDTSDLPTGTYFYTVHTYAGSTTKKLIKIN